MEVVSVARRRRLIDAFKRRMVDDVEPRVQEHEQMMSASEPRVWMKVTTRLESWNSHQGFRLLKQASATLLLLVLVPSIAMAQSFVAPLTNMQITQYFAAYELVSSGKYHAGMDIVQQGSSSYTQRNVQVSAVRAGTVHKIFGINIAGNSLRRWNTVTQSYSWGHNSSWAYFFSNDTSMLCLVNAVLCEISEEWEAKRIYLNMESV